ncbi:hypothetical protein BHE74_00051025, partial [Ensete ventricosum]
MAHNSQVSLAVCRSTALPPASSLMSPPLPWTSSSSLLFSLVCFALSVHTEVLTGHRYVGRPGTRPCRSKIQLLASSLPQGSFLGPGRLTHQIAPSPLAESTQLHDACFVRCRAPHERLQQFTSETFILAHKVFRTVTG